MDIPTSFATPRDELQFYRVYFNILASSLDTWLCKLNYRDTCQESEMHPNDLINGVVHNLDTYREYCLTEAVTGYSFRKDFSLSSLKTELLPQETLAALKIHGFKL